MFLYVIGNGSEGTKTDHSSMEYRINIEFLINIEFFFLYLLFIELFMIVCFYML